MDVGCRICLLNQWNQPWDHIGYICIYAQMVRSPSSPKSANSIQSHCVGEFWVPTNFHKGHKTSKVQVFFGSHLEISGNNSAASALGAHQYLQPPHPRHFVSRYITQQEDCPEHLHNFHSANISKSRRDMVAQDHQALSTNPQAMGDRPYGL